MFGWGVVLGFRGEGTKPWRRRRRWTDDAAPAPWCQNIALSSRPPASGQSDRAAAAAASGDDDAAAAAAAR